MLAACPEGSFGHNCTQTCSCVRGNCDPINGFCACPAGYHGYLCDRLCSGGAGCSERCQCANGARCDYVTGQCVCPAGWTGKTCQRSCRQVWLIPGVFGANCSQRLVFFVKGPLTQAIFGVISNQACKLAAISWQYVAARLPLISNVIEF